VGQAQAYVGLSLQAADPHVDAWGSRTAYLEQNASGAPMGAPLVSHLQRVLPLTTSG
jgi:hypothetical protein